MNSRQAFKSFNAYFLLLLPLFFVLHGYVQNYPLIKLPDAALLLLKYLLVGLTVLLLLRPLFSRSLIKAAFYTFILLSVEFFFGAVQDFLKKDIPFLSKYSVLIPLILVVLVAGFFLIRRSRSNFAKVTGYLNYLFLILIVVDAAYLVLQDNKGVATTRTIVLAPCDSCRKPNIYLILADEYAGDRELNDLFHFDNSAFEDFLSSKGFQRVQNTRSNYNYTPYSMASLFNMDYIKGISSNSSDFNNRKIVYNGVNKNRWIDALRSLGYEIQNESLFDFAGIPSRRHYTGFYAVGNRIITSQTLSARVEKDLWYHLILHYKIGWAQDNYLGNLRDDISDTYANTIKATAENGEPKFVYAHFIMPHYPYLYDENGQQLSLEEALSNSKDHYLAFLKYANGFYSKMIGEILAKDKTNPIIIFMSDHGYTKYNGQDPSYNFTNTINVYNAKKLPDSITNVNLFRYLLNNEFHQRLPLLKDSTIFLGE